MHQCLVQWIGDTVEVVFVDSSFSITSAEALTWSYEMVKCLSGHTWETNFLKVADYQVKLIQAVGTLESS